MDYQLFNLSFNIRFRFKYYLYLIIEIQQTKRIVFNEGNSNDSGAI